MSLRGSQLLLRGLHGLARPFIYTHTTALSGPAVLHHHTPPPDHLNGTNPDGRKSFRAHAAHGGGREDGGRNGGLRWFQSEDRKERDGEYCCCEEGSEKHDLRLVRLLRGTLQFLCGAIHSARALNVSSVALWLLDSACHQIHLQTEA